MAGGRFRSGRYFGAAAALAGRRMVLVSGHVGAGHRIGAGGQSGLRRPIHLFAGHWIVYLRRVGRGRSGVALAGGENPGARRRHGRARGHVRQG